ncbi:MAG: archease [Nitrospirae bacterium]|nr:archease [Nitrospirota bacterium]
MQPDAQETGPPPGAARPPGWWEHFPHQADMGVRGHGATLAAAFEQAALAMTAVIADPARVRQNIKVSVTCAAPDPELLLAEWLNALVFEMATRRALFSTFRVTIDQDAAGVRLKATARGEAVDPVRHQPAVEVKGATYTALRVARQGGGWIAQCVVDV